MANRKTISCVAREATEVSMWCQGVIYPLGVCLYRGVGQHTGATTLPPFWKKPEGGAPNSVQVAPVMT